MIKANELSVGNWVQYEGKPVKVAAVHSKKIGIHVTPHKLQWIRLDLLEPIPLTIKIIEQIGVKSDKYSGHSYTIKESIGIVPTRGEFMIHDTETVSFVYVKYLHELQNVFSLYKKNINITF